MKQHMIQVVTALALLASSAVHAQDAVQWKVSDGGNGHWYGYGRVQISDATFLQTQDAAVRAGGHLPTVTSASENTFVFQNIGGGLGLFRQPGGAWQNITGEPVSYQNWAPGDPNGSTTALVFAAYCCHPSNTWADYSDADLGNPADPYTDFRIEWSADCNNDGIVDYGQCHDGSLLDTNTNNVPDCCELGTPCVLNMISNGSFEVGASQSCGWVCLGIGDPRLVGWDITLNSVDRERTDPGGCNEGWFASDGHYSLDMNGCSVGGKIQQSVATVPGTTYDLSFDLSMNPTNVPVAKLRVTAVGIASQDFEYQRTATSPQPYDSHQMQFVATAAGTVIEFESLNREYPSQWNGPVLDSVRLIPHVRTAPTCHDADLFINGVINGADLGILLSQWGPAPIGTVSDIDHDGIVNGADLGFLLSVWGTCTN